MSQSWWRQLFSISSRSTAPRPHARPKARRTILRTEALEDRAMPSITFTNLVNNPDPAKPDLHAALENVRTQLTGVYTAAGNLPFVGDQIQAVSDVVSDFQTPLENALKALPPTSTQQDVKDALWNALGPNGAKILGDTDGSGGQNPTPEDITEDDVIVSLNGNTVAIELRLTAAEEVASTPVTFDLGLKAVPFAVETSSGVEFSIGYDYHTLKFAYTEGAAQPFTFDTAQADELAVTFSADFAPGATAQATLGFLNATITDGAFDDPNKHSAFTGAFTVDVTANGPAGFSLADDFNAKADVYLKVDAGFSDNFPSVGTDLELHWGFGTTYNPNDDKPYFALNNVRVNLGNYLSEVLAPLADVLDKVTAPIQPIIDVLKAPVPVLSDLSHLLGQGDITLDGIAKLAKDYLPEGYKELAALALTIVDILDLVDKIQSNGPANQLVINFGSFVPSEKDDLRTLTAAVDPHDPNVNLLTTKSLSALSVGGFAGFDIQAFTDQIDASPLAGTPLGNKIKDTVAMLNNGIHYKSPILDDPANAIFKIALGQDAELFTFSADFVAHAEFHLPVELPIGLDVSLDGTVTPNFHFAIGYDTYGLRKFITNGASDAVDLLDGIYLDEGSHFYVDAGISATASVGAGIFEAGVEGGVQANLHIDTTPALNLDNDPAKIRLRSELKDYLFTTSGAISAYLEAFVKVGVDTPLGFVGYEDEFPIAGGTLLSWGDDGIGDPFKPPQPLNLAVFDPATGILTLNIGQQPNLPPCNANQKNAIDESFTVIGLKPKSAVGDSVVVSAFGFSEKFHGVTKIVANGGKGDDTIILQPAAIPGAMLTAEVELSGGDGADQIVYGGTGKATLFGDAGNDLLQGGSGENVLDGGADDDSLTSGAGPGQESHLHGGADDDVLKGGAGPNWLYGEGGADDLYAGDQGDYLDGGIGNDLLVAGGGSDQLLGGDGNDVITWHVTNGSPVIVTVDGGSGSNVLGVVGSDLADTFTLSKNGTGVILQVTAATLFGSHLEQVNIDAGPGKDATTVNALEGSGVRFVGLNLGDIVNPDFAEDTIVINATPGPDDTTVQTESVFLYKPIHQNYVKGGVTRVSRAGLVVRAANVADSLTVNALGGPDTVNVFGITGPTTIDAGTADDTVNVSAAKVDDFTGLLIIEAGAGSNALSVSESSAVAADAITVTNADVTSGLLPGVHYQATGGSYGGGVGVTATPFGDQVAIRSTLEGVATTINAHGGNDTILVSSSAPALAGNLLGILGSLAIDAGAGLNTLTLSDVTAAGGNGHIVVNDTQVTSFAGPNDVTPVTYKATGGAFAGIVLEGAASGTLTEAFDLISPKAPVTVHANGGDDTVRVISLSQPATVETGAGNDVVVLGYLSNNLDGIAAPVQVAGSSGTDLLYAFDQSAGSGHTYNLTAAGLARSGSGAIGFNGLEHVYLTASGFDDQLNVQGVPAATVVHLNAGGGIDTLAGTPATNTFQITQANGGTLNGTVLFSAVENLTGGASNDRFVFADGQAVSGGVQGGGGSDTLDYSAYTTPVMVDFQLNEATGVGGYDGIESVVGGAASDALVGTNVSNLWEVTADNAGTFHGANLTVAFSSIENLRGGTAVDRFTLGDGVHVTGALDGRGGRDTLDYSAWTQAVSVNLTAGTATGIGAILNVENVTGGAGNDTLLGDGGTNVLRGGAGHDVLKGADGDDILIGGAGNDTLYAGTGRNILIGGLGVDDLTGGVGDDILVGGSTAHDGSDAALLSLLAEWQTNQTYQVRVGHLQNGGGLNGAYVLTPQTVADDGVKDDLFGGAGTDWFWGKADTTDATTVNNVPEIVS